MNSRKQADYLYFFEPGYSSKCDPETFPEIEEDGYVPLHMMLPVALSRKIDDYRRQQTHIQTRTAAVRALIQKGLDAYSNEGTNNE